MLCACYPREPQPAEPVWASLSLCLPLSPSPSAFIIIFGCGKVHVCTHRSAHCAPGHLSTGESSARRAGWAHTQPRSTLQGWLSSSFSQAPLEHELYLARWARQEEEDEEAGSHQNENEIVPAREKSRQGGEGRGTGRQEEDTRRGQRGRERIEKDRHREREVNWTGSEPNKGRRPFIMQRRERATEFVTPKGVNEEGNDWRWWWWWFPSRWLRWLRAQR